MELESPGLIFTIISFLVLLTVLVFVHEWGHFWVARRLGVRVSVFSIGFGREILGFTDKKGTRWRLSWIPFGGYVRFFGDDDATSSKSSTEGMSEEEKRVAFSTQHVAKRAAIVAAGPLINFLFAILILAVLFFSYGRPIAPAGISDVMDASPAAEAGLQAGDEILRINGKVAESFDDIQRVIALNTGDAVVFEIRRGESLQTVTVYPELVEQTDRFGNTYEVRRLGITSPPLEVRRVGFFSSFGVATAETIRLTGMMLTSVGQILMGDRSTDELGGPVRIAQYTGQQATLGLTAFVTFMALISINLGLVNLFPIPMLDGGHLVFYGIEAILGRPVDEKIQNFSFMIGMAIVLTLFAFFTVNDIRNLPIFD